MRKVHHLQKKKKWQPITTKKGLLTPNPWESTDIKLAFGDNNNNNKKKHVLHVCVELRITPVNQLN